MKTKNIMFFALAFGISFIAATHRWGDSAHSIGLIAAAGGKVRHPSFLESGKDRYTLIATATVIPPYRGSAEIFIEGMSPSAYQVYLSEPVVDLGVRRHPRIRDNVITGLKPYDRIALWVVMKPPLADPVCGMHYRDGFSKVVYNGRDYFFCSRNCAETFRMEPSRFDSGRAATGTYVLTLRDTRTEHPVLSIPLLFKGKEEARNASGHQH